MKTIRIILTDTEAVDLLRTLREKSNKHTKLHKLAQERSNTKSGSKNAEKLMSKHTASKQKAESLIKKMVTIYLFNPNT